MKAAGITLSIIGSVFSLLFALVYFVTGSMISSSDYFSSSVSGPYDIVGIMTGVMWILALLLVVSMGLGIAGAVLIGKRGVTAGILLVVATLISAITVYAILAAVCFAISGIFAFMWDRRALLNPVTADAAPIEDDGEPCDMGI